MTKVSRFIYAGQLYLYGKSTKELSHHLPIHAFIMKHICLLIAFLFSTLQGYAQSTNPPMLWAAEVSNSATSFLDFGMEYYDIVADPLSGGVYTAASCYTPSTFSNQFLVTPNFESQSLVLAKYDYQGNLDWIKDFGFVGPLFTGVRICTSLSGDIYLSGTFSVPEIDFGNGIKVSRNCNTNCDELFLVKFSATGQAQWARTVYNTENSRFEIAGIKVDNIGNLFLLGNYSGTKVSFGPNFVYENLPPLSFFLANYNAESGGVQAVHFGASDCQPNKSIHLAINNSGQIVMVGELYGVLKFANGIIVAPPTSPTVFSQAFFIAGVSTNGEVQWAKGLSSSEYMNVLGIDMDDEGQAYLAIDASTDLMLDNNTILNISSDYAGMVLKIGATEFSTPVFIEYNSNDYAVLDVKLDNWGNIYTAGYTSESIEIGNTNVAIDGCLDGLLTATSSAGVLQWARTIGGPGCEAIRNFYSSSSIAFDGAGFMHVTGIFYEGFEEDGVSMAGVGGFVAKFNTSIVNNKEPATLGNLQFSPNPNMGSFTLSLEDAPGQNTLLQIHDLHGRLVFAQEIQSTQQEINTVLPAGAYIVTLQADKLLARQKLIVQR